MNTMTEVERNALVFTGDQSKGIEMHTIERIGITQGRFPRYDLLIDGVNIGEVRRTIVSGGDAMNRSARYDAWAIHGTTVETQAEAEQKLIIRAKRFGHIPA